MIYFIYTTQNDTVFVFFRCKCGNCIVASFQNISECYCCSESEGCQDSMKSGLVPTKFKHSAARLKKLNSPYFCIYVGLSKSKWIQQNPILFLNIQASSKIVWFEMLRANHRTLRRLPPCMLRSVRDDHRHKTVWYEAQYPLVSFLCCSNSLQHICLAFLRTTFAAFPTKTSKCTK